MNEAGIEITKYLPHRYPFLYVDKVVNISNESIVALKNVSFNEPYFQGHFPNEPIMPGVIIVEALAQTCGILAFKSRNKTPSDGYNIYLTGVEKARFRLPVRPGNQLFLHAKINAIKQQLWRFDCEAYVDDKLACSLKLSSVFRKLDDVEA